MKTGFLGGGVMAEALLGAQARRRGFLACNVHVCDIASERRAGLQRRFGIVVHADPEPVLAGCETIVLAVKPQNLADLLERIAPHVERRHLLVSIAAGWSLRGIQRRLQAPTRLARIMPNLAVRCRAGMSVYCLGRAARTTDRRRVERLLQGTGQVMALPERHFDVVTALSGSGPAFLACVLDALVRAAVSHGLDENAARRLATQTMLGTARVLGEENLAPGALIRAVASPGGTTAAGLAVLGASDLDSVMAATLRAAVCRATELNSSLTG